MRHRIERTLLMLLGIGVAVIPIRSQTNPEKPSFEVVSVKPAPPNLSMMRGGGPRGDRLTLSSVPLRMLMNMAYRDPNGEPFGGPEIFGGPDWMDSALFDVEAKADCSGGPLSNGQLALMIQSMLEDRFQLKAHVETRDMPVYNLVVGKDGPKLKASADQTPPAPIVMVGQLCGTVPAAPTLPSFPEPGADMSKFMSQMPRGSMITMMQATGAMTLQATAAPVSRLVSNFKLYIGRQVIDKTGLTGLFDMALKFSTDGLALPAMPAGVATGLRGGPSSSTPSGPLAGPAANGTPLAADPVPTLFSAIQDLGLRLEPARGPVRVIVIDNVQKPSEN